jgi:hypothetical protein
MTVHELSLSFCFLQCESCFFGIFRASNDPRVLDVDSSSTVRAGASSLPRYSEQKTIAAGTGNNEIVFLRR